MVGLTYSILYVQYMWATVCTQAGSSWCCYLATFLKTNPEGFGCNGILCICIGWFSLAQFNTTG